MKPITTTRCSHCNNHLRRKNGVKERQKTDTFSKMLHKTFKIIDKGKGNKI
jgi:hypothetical protein